MNSEITGNYLFWFLGQHYYILTFLRCNSAYTNCHYCTLKNTLAVHSKHSSGFVGQSVKIMFWLKKGRWVTHIHTLCCVSDNYLAFYRSLHQRVWSSWVRANTVIESTWVFGVIIKVISRVILAHYILPIHFRIFNCHRAYRIRAGFFSILLHVNTLFMYFFT